jgi:hypothetical protein
MWEGTSAVKLRGQVPNQSGEGRGRKDRMRPIPMNVESKADGDDRKEPREGAENVADGPAEP